MIICFFDNGEELDIILFISKGIEANRKLFFALKKIMYVRHSSEKAPYLCVFHFTKRASGLAGLNRQHVLASIAADSRQTLTIKDEQGQYTHEYKALCQPFYLKF